MNINIETVNIPEAPIQNLGAYFAYPQTEGKIPGVVIIHEAFGLNDNIKDITRRFAEAGYAALAVDLFAGRNQMICMFRFFGGMFLNSLNHEGIHSLKAALSWLEVQPQIDSGKLGAVGFCMGGGFAIAWASTDPRLTVIAPFYAFNPRPLSAVERSCPVVGSYPANDITKGAAEKLDQELSKHNIPHDIKIYPGAKHSFFNDRGGNHDPAASQDAWERMLKFFKEQMG